MARLISITQSNIIVDGHKLTPEEYIVYTARVSSPQNQNNLETSSKLLKYLLKHRHWSPFEMCHMTVEIETSRAIAAQILRHAKGFSFQEYSQRYSDASELGFANITPRLQDTKNRQNSIEIDNYDPRLAQFEISQKNVNKLALESYKAAIAAGISKESARFLLPLSTMTRMYVCGPVRSWITYFMVRLGVSTQLEHRQIAQSMLEVFKQEFPIITEVIVDLNFGGI